MPSIDPIDEFNAIALLCRFQISYSICLTGIFIIILILLSLVICLAFCVPSMIFSKRVSGIRLT